MTAIGIVGVGYWGPNLVRNFSALDNCRCVAASDLNKDRLAVIKQLYPSLEVTTDYRDLLNRTDIDAIAIATPVNTHFEIAREGLSAGKHLLIEKPMTSNSDDAKWLIDEAARCQRVLLVDHTFVYMGAVRKISQLIQDGALGDLYYYDSTRVNLGIFQSDVNVLWDLAVHDLSILDYLVAEKPMEVSATGMGHIVGKPENIAYITLFYNSNMVAHINVNWLSPVKLRQTLISGAKRMVIFDDLHPSEKIKVYDCGVSLSRADDVYRAMVEYRIGDILIPRYDRTEALRVEAQHFVNCIAGTEQPITTGDMGLRIVKILEAATISLQKNGAPVTLELT